MTNSCHPSTGQSRESEGNAIARSLWRPTVIKARQMWRATKLALWLLVCALGFAIFAAGSKRRWTGAARRLWLGRVARGVLRIMRVEVRIEGRRPTHGVLVSNHLSYLDIPVLAAVAPAVFVSKYEVRSWPLFGWFALCAGTIFVNRKSRQDIGRVAREMQAALNCGALVILFPEGTSSNGQTVLPFRSSLLEPLRSPRHLSTIAALDYQLADGCVENEVCYWGDHRLVSHLWCLLGKERILARARFCCPHRPTGGNRKLLAHSLRQSVMALRYAETCTQ